MSRMVLTTDGGRHLSLPVHGSSMVTCLIFSHGRIISASDDNTINVYSTIDGHIMHVLRGHYGGVWDLAVTNDTLASCSLDTTVRIWNLATGRCMHVFGGHTRTVRCLIIVEPELVDVGGDNGTISMDSEQWPKRPMVVSGSRDFSLYVWNLPRDGEPEYKCSHANGPSTISTDASQFFLCAEYVLMFYPCRYRIMTTLTSNISFKVTRALCAFWLLGAVC